MNIWHRRFGHLNIKDIMSMRKGIVNGLQFKNAAIFYPCVVCMKGKQTRSSFKRTGARASSILELIHMNLCGPMEKPSIGGARYFYTIIDDYSRKTFVYFFK